MLGRNRSPTLGRCPGPLLETTHHAVRIFVALLEAGALVPVDGGCRRLMPGFEAHLDDLRERGCEKTLLVLHHHQQLVVQRHGAKRTRYQRHPNIIPNITIFLAGSCNTFCSKLPDYRTNLIGFETKQFQRHDSTGSAGIAVYESASWRKLELKTPESGQELTKRNGFVNGSLAKLLTTPAAVRMVGFSWR